MRINLFFSLFVILVALSFLFFSDQAESLDITRIIQGTIKEIRADSIKIVNDPNGSEVRIAVDSNTVYDGVQKLTDLKAGDKVQIEYQKSHSKNMATMVTKIETEG